MNTVYVSCRFNPDISNVIAVRLTLDSAKQACGDFARKALTDFEPLTPVGDDTIWRAWEAGNELDYDHGYFIYAMPVGG